MAIRVNYFSFWKKKKTIWSVSLAESVRLSFSERFCLKKQSVELNEKCPPLGCVFEHLITDRWHWFSRFEILQITERWRESMVNTGGECWGFIACPTASSLPDRCDLSASPSDNYMPYFPIIINSPSGIIRQNEIVSICYFGHLVFCCSCLSTFYFYLFFNSESCDAYFF